MQRLIYNNKYDINIIKNNKKLTTGSLWKITTRPPLSPVARRSPSWLNSTHEIISAKTEYNMNNYITIYFRIFKIYIIEIIWKKKKKEIIQKREK